MDIVKPKLSSSKELSWMTVRIFPDKKKKSYPCSDCISIIKPWKESYLLCLRTMPSQGYCVTQVGKGSEWIYFNLEPDFCCRETYTASLH